MEKLIKALKLCAQASPSVKGVGIASGALYIRDKSSVGMTKTGIKEFYSFEEETVTRQSSVFPSTLREMVQLPSAMAHTVPS